MTVLYYIVSYRIDNKDDSWKSLIRQKKIPQLCIIRSIVSNPIVDEKSLQLYRIDGTISY